MGTGREYTAALFDIFIFELRKMVIQSVWGSFLVREERDRINTLGGAIHICDALLDVQGVENFRSVGLLMPEIFPAPPGSKSACMVSAEPTVNAVTFRSLWSKYMTVDNSGSYTTFHHSMLHHYHTKARPTGSLRASTERCTRIGDLAVFRVSQFFGTYG